MYRFLLFPLALLAFILFLAACSVVEPAPALPPPPPLVAGDQPPPIVLELGTVPVDARETAVAESSPTPIQTPTLAPTVTPTAEPEPVINPAQMPAISHDLLFVGNGKLKRWQRDGQVVTLLDSNVVDYSLSADGKRAVVAQLVDSTEISNTVTAVTQTVGVYALHTVNLETGNSQLLVPAISSFGDPVFQLSQDGKHLAFSGLGLGDPESLTLGEEMTRDLFVMETETGQPPKKIWDCAGYCVAPVWHQDNNLFVFGEDEGLLLYNLAAKEPEILVSVEPDLSYSQSFEPISWAKNGRWLLLKMHGIHDSNLYVFDVPTNQLMIIPFTSSYDGSPYANVAWMQDDRLFLVRNEEETAVGETWRVNVDAGEVQRDESVVLAEDFLRPWAPVHWENGRFGYGLLDLSNRRGETSLFQRTAFNEPSELMNVIPEASPNLEIVWAPSGSAAIVTVGGMVSDEPFSVYYVPVNDEAVNLTTAVGLRGNNFTWLP